LKSPDCVACRLRMSSRTRQFSFVTLPNNLNVCVIIDRFRDASLLLLYRDRVLWKKTKTAKMAEESATRRYIRFRPVQDGSSFHVQNQGDEFHREHTIRALLDKGADPNKSTCRGLSALVVGLFLRKTHITEILVQYGVDMEAPTILGPTGLQLVGLVENWHSARSKCPQKQ
jgi:hypothetical protein